MPKKEILKKNLKTLTESKTQQLRSIQQVTQELMRLKTNLVTDPTNPLKNNDVKYITDTVGKLLKTFDGIHDEKIDAESTEEDEVVVSSNEKSEGYGKMPEEVMGENVVQLTQKTLKNVIRRVIQERKK
jgi:nitrous oxide reductase